MSGLYNAIFGENNKADVLLACLGLTRADCGRYRDCYITGENIVIHTRNGGGNRDDYQGVIDHLSEHPCYVRDADDDFDCTYADIYFRFPEQYSDELKAMAVAHPDVTPHDKWQALFARLEKP